MITGLKYIIYQFSSNHWMVPINSGGPTLWRTVNPECPPLRRTVNPDCPPLQGIVNCDCSPLRGTVNPDSHPLRGTVNLDCSSKRNISFQLSTYFDMILKNFIVQTYFNLFMEKSWLTMEFITMCDKKPVLYQSLGDNKLKRSHSLGNSTTQLSPITRDSELTVTSYEGQ